MNCNEINMLIDDYLDDLLDPETKKEFEESIEYCEEQKQLLQKYKLLEKRISHLPLSFSPDEGIFDELKDNLLEIDTLRSETDEADKKSRLKPGSKSKVSIKEKSSRRKGVKKASTKKSIAAYLLVSVATTALIAFGIYYYLYIYNNTSPWKFNVRYGLVTVNQKNGVEKIYKDDTIVLWDSSNALVSIPGKFDLELFSNSSIQVLDTRTMLNQVKVLYGKAVFNSINRESNFSLKQGNISISETNGEFIYETGLDGSIAVSVKRGWVEVTAINESFRVAGDYSFSIHENSRLTLPVHKNASPKFKSELNQLNSTVNDVAALSTLMIETKPTDALTLLRILELVTPDKRELIFQKVSNIFQPPANIDKQDILKGNKRMLEQWWSYIETKL